jgi:hypothetical protein
VEKLSKSTFYGQSQLQAYGWRAFCVESLCGVIAIVWYLFFLAERTTLRMLTRLEKLASHRVGDLSPIERACNDLLQDEGSCSDPRNADGHDSRNSNPRSF